MTFRVGIRQQKIVTNRGDALSTPTQSSLRTVKSRTAMERLRQRVAKGRRLYDAGNRAFRNGDLESAERSIAQAVREGPDNAAWVERLGFIVERRKRFADALEIYCRALEMEADHAEWQYRAAVCANKIGDRAQAVEHLETAVRLDATHTRAADALAQALPNNLPEWRKLDLLELACASSPVAHSLVALANSAFRMERYQECLTALDEVAQTRPLVRSEVVLLAQASLGLRDVERAYTVLAELARRSKDEKIQKRGPGHFLQTKGDWQGAEQLYRASWDNGDRDAEVAFGLGFSLDRQYLREEAAQWYQRAVALPSGDRAYWNYKYAHALECSEDLREAAAVYSRALELGGYKQATWFYRLGACLFRIGDLEHAFDALIEWAGGPEKPFSISSDADRTDEALGTLSQNVARSEWIQEASEQARYDLLARVKDIALQQERWLVSARHYRRAGDLDRSISAYLTYLKATGLANSRIVAEAATLLREMGQIENACQLMLDAEEFEHLDGLDIKKLQKSAFDRRRLRYSEYTHRFEIDPNAVLFESFWGSKVNDNPLAIYESMRQDSRFDDCRFYWSVAEGAALSDRLIDDDRTVIVRYGSIAYDRLLATASILVTNTSFVEYFHRRDGQTVLNTWHGTPLKTLGKRIGTGVLEHANITRNFLNTTALFVPNEYTAEALVRDYDIDGLGTCRVVAGGSPRLDTLINDDGCGRDGILRQIGLDARRVERVVFFAPTWRGSDDQRSLDVSGAVEVISALARIPGITVLFRAHHMVEGMLAGVEVDATVVPPAVDTYDVLKCTDVLVTDYSSLLFDFLPTGRRVICYTPDLERYKEERGLYLLPSDVISDVAMDLPTLTSMVEDTEWTGPDERYRASAKLYSAMEDGNATGRCLDLLSDRSLEAGRSTVRLLGDDRRTVVLFESLLPNGILSAMRNLVRGPAASGFRFVLSVNQSDMKAHADRNAAMKSVARDMGIVGRVGQQAVDPEERYALGEYSRTRGHVSPRLTAIVNRAYRREFRRVFGTPKDVFFVDFEGYNRFWNALFARGVPASCWSGVVLHNQIVDEQEQKFPYLRELFVTYAQMNRVAAVSSSLAVENERRLDEAGVPIVGGISVVHNILNVSEIIEQADSGTSLWDDFPNANPRLISLGRFSPEKNQELLIRALQVVRTESPHAELVLLGEGPTSNRMQALARDLGLGSAVHFCGFSENPMTTVQDSDMFLLGSIHEGQPMVLLECMALGVPAICTPVPGSIEAVREGNGIVSEFSVEQYARDILDALRTPRLVHFDAESYNRRAVREFEDFVAEPESHSRESLVVRVD